MSLLDIKVAAQVFGGTVTVVVPEIPDRYMESGGKPEQDVVSRLPLVGLVGYYRPLGYARLLSELVTAEG